MQIVAFILAILAILVFVVEYARTKHLCGVGLALLTTAWIVQVVVQTGTHITAK